jgi:hypothetical protein
MLDDFFDLNIETRDFFKFARLEINFIEINQISN